MLACWEESRSHDMRCILLLCHCHNASEKLYVELFAFITPVERLCRKGRGELDYSHGLDIQCTVASSVQCPSTTPQSRIDLSN